MRWHDGVVTVMENIRAPTENPVLYVAPASVPVFHPNINRVAHTRGVPFFTPLIHGGNS